MLRLMDKARLHCTKITQLNLKEFKIDRIPYLSYSPDISPCHFNAFQSLEMFVLPETAVEDVKDLGDALADWMGSRTEKFWRGRFEQLSERWTEIVRSQGKYFDERQNT